MKCPEVPGHAIPVKLNALGLQKFGRMSPRSEIADAIGTHPSCSRYIIVVIRGYKSKEHGVVAFDSKYLEPAVEVRLGGRKSN